MERVYILWFPDFLNAKLRAMLRVLLLLLCLSGFLQASIKPSPVFVPPQMSRPDMADRESFRMTIENKVLGSVMMSLDKGVTWHLLGTVRSPLSALRDIYDAEFTASDWAYVGSVAATAVNAIHVKVTQPGKHARIFSILPAEFSNPEGFQTSYRDNPSSIFLDIPGGTGLFSGDWGLRLGDALYGVSGSEWVPWPEDRVPKDGDVLGFIAREAPSSSWMIEIDNVKDGRVMFVTGNGTPVQIAKVVQPFSGSGRFLGTFFQDVGKVRANHPGVVDISTSPFGERGGVQIVPFFHSKAPNLGYVHHSPVYMVVAPMEGDPPLEGREPLFMNYIRPGDEVTARVKGEWVPFPVSIGKNVRGLTMVEAIRITPGVK